MTDDTSGKLPLTPEREAYLLCGNALSNVAWLIGQYDIAPDHGLAVRSLHHLHEAEKHIEVALRYHDDAGQRDRYQHHYDALRNRVLATFTAFREGDKIPSTRNIDEKIRRVTILNLYLLSRQLGRGVNESYEYIALCEGSNRDAIEQSLRNIAKPYMDGTTPADSTEEKTEKRENALLLAFLELRGIDVTTVADLDMYELRERLQLLSEKQAGQLIMSARAMKGG